MKKVHPRDLTTLDNRIYYNGSLFSGLIYSQYVSEPYPSLPFEKDHAEEEVINGIPTNVVKEYYKNGQLCKLVHTAPNQSFYMKTRVAGAFETYYKNGKLCEKGEIVNQRLSGKYECYYEDGSLFVSADFAANSLLGNGTCYYRNGSVCQEGDILARAFAERVEKRVMAGHLAPDGYSSLGNVYGIPYADHYLSDKLYDDVNNEFDFAPYPRLLLNFKSRDKNGRVITIISDGIKECYDKEGNKYLVEACNEKLQKHGQSCKYAYGSVSEIESYANGIRDGLYLKFNYHGFVSEKGCYEKGQKVGKWEYFADNGVLR